MQNPGDDPMWEMDEVSQRFAILFRGGWNAHVPKGFICGCSLKGRSLPPMCGTG